MKMRVSDALYVSCCEVLTSERWQYDVELMNFSTFFIMWLNQIGII